MSCFVRSQPLITYLVTLMLTQLSAVKSRLAITVTDYDDLLTSAIKAVSARFDKETNRTLARTVAVCQDFDASDTEILPACYPVEAVTKFELKTNETDGWIEQTGIECLIRRQCVISLHSPISYLPSSTSRALARVTYTGGYVLPGDTPDAGQTPLPDDLEQAAIEQVAYWFRNREKTGLLRSWPHGGTYDAYLQSDLLLEVRAVLKKYERWTI
jgi:hypothetical protein